MKDRLSLSLLSLRITIFLVMFMWTLDKFLNPQHASTVFEHFYFLKGFGPTLLALIGAGELLIIGTFLIGFMKKYSYGLVLLLHLISTLSSYKQYFNPWDNLLFFAAWPMLAGCLTLFLLRDYDSIFSIERTSNDSV